MTPQEVAQITTKWAEMPEGTQLVYAKMPKRRPDDALTTIDMKLPIDAYALQAPPQFGPLPYSEEIAATLMAVGVVFVETGTWYRCQAVRKDPQSDRVQAAIMSPRSGRDAYDALWFDAEVLFQKFVWPSDAMLTGSGFECDSDAGYGPGRPVGASIASEPVLFARQPTPVPTAVSALVGFSHEQVEADDEDDEEEDDDYDDDDEQDDV
jgi:hypothetical protein